MFRWHLRTLIQITVSLNVDGSVFTNPGVTENSGLTRDHEGFFLRGFYGNIDHSCILYAEILGLYHDLDLCWSSGCQRVFFLFRFLACDSVGSGST